MTSTYLAPPATERPPPLEHRDITLATLLDSFLEKIAAIARRAAAPAVRFSLAVIMLWFGIPKLLPGGSPAEDIAIDTVEVLTLGIIHGDIARLMVGGIEVVLGIALIVGRVMPLVILALLGHMAATFTPLVLFPAATWHGPLVGTLEGQYILKNLIIIAGIVVLTGYGMRRK